MVDSEGASKSVNEQDAEVRGDPAKTASDNGAKDLDRAQAPTFDDSNFKFSNFEMMGR